MLTGVFRGARPIAAARPAASKVPEVTAWFWVTKLVTTGLGEAVSDYLVHRSGPVFAVGLGGAAFAVSLLVQFAVRGYHTWVYWPAVAMVAVFGTMAADVLHVGLGVPYLVSACGFLAALGVVFAAWYLREKTLSIHSIVTPRREVFYWAAVITTFAMGTAAGDLTATSLRLGYFASGVAFALAITIPATWYRVTRRNPVASFWVAYILTRPVGASFADWMGRPRSWGGLGWGRGPVSLGLAALLVMLLGWLSVAGQGVTRRPGRHRACG